MPVSQCWRTLGVLLVLCLASMEVEWLPAYLEKRQLETLVFDDNKDLALVFSMAKVSSTSLWVAIGAHRELWAYYEEFNETYESISKTHAAVIANDFLRKAPEGKRIWVFTAVRNPFARMMSTYFEDIEMERHLGNLTHEQILAMNMTDMESDFMNNWYNWDLTDTWFSNTFKELVGVDLTQYKFPYESGRLIVQGHAFGKPLVVVLLRAEDVTVWWDIMRHNVPHWVGAHKQDAKELWYGPKYEEFKRHFLWPAWTVEEVLKGDSLRFYTIAERAKFCHAALAGSSGRSR